MMRYKTIMSISVGQACATFWGYGPHNTLYVYLENTARATISLLLEGMRKSRKKKTEV